MPNYAEELVFWYLRLNGFFPISNFVIHRSQHVKHSSDIDVVAVRLPFVYEEIGGKEDDWDKSLFSLFKPKIPIGLMCQVKSGNFNLNSIFSEDAIKYAVGRFGFTPNHNELDDSVLKNSLTVVNKNFQIGKVFFSNNTKQQHTDRFFHVALPNIRRFIKSRIEKYPKEKFGDRIFFSSLLVQEMIDTTVLNQVSDN